MDTPLKGSCLCGQVTYRCDADMGIFQYCHCSRCRKFTGSAYAANLFVRAEDFHWLGGEALVKQYAPEHTKYFTTRFCRGCGSSLPWLSKNGKVVIVPAGTLDNLPATRPSQNIFYASRAGWEVCAGDLPRYDQLPPRR